MCRCGVDAEKCALMGARASCASLVVLIQGTCFEFLCPVCHALKRLAYIQCVLHRLDLI